MDIDLGDGYSTVARGLYEGCRESGLTVGGVVGD